MENYYSILSVQIRPEIQEKISIGFLLVGEGKVYFNYSKNKLSVAKSLLSDNGYKLLKDSIKNIEATAINESKNSELGKQLLISPAMEKNSFSIDYIVYLSRYNNNVLSFSAPKKIDVSLSQDIFSKLFSKFIDSTEFVPAIIRVNTVDTFKAAHRVTLDKHFNVEREFTSVEIPNLIAPVRVDLLGKNEIPVYMQSIDLNRNVYNIENDLAQLFFLRLAFATNSKGFVLTSEPDKKEKKQHDIWSQLRSSKLFEYVDLSEAEKIIQYAEEHNVLPLVGNSGAIVE